MFALAITVSVELRKRRWQHPEVLVLVACALLIAIALAVGTSLRVSQGQTSALDTLNGNNTVIADALERHKVDVLVGNYWRVLPVKLAMHGNITAMPLGDCTQPTTSLTSSAWQPNLHNHSSHTCLPSVVVWPAILTVRSVRSQQHMDGRTPCRSSPVYRPPH